MSIIHTDNYGFVSGSVVAGVTLVAGAISSTTLSSTAGIINPLGSGVIVRVRSLSVAPLAIQTALKPLYLGVQINASVVGSVPSAITKQTVLPTPLGILNGGAAQAFTYSAATLNFASGHELFDALFFPFGMFETAVGWQPGIVEFGDELLLAPDSNIALVCQASLSTVVNTWFWQEFPIGSI